MISWLQSGEEITITVENVKLKKDNGLLYITNLRVCWINKNATKAPTLQYEYNKIKAQRISPDSAEKVRLQLVLYDDSTITFHFNNPRKELQKAERERVKEILVELIQRSKRNHLTNHENGCNDKQVQQVNKLLEIKQRVLQASDEMFIMYKTLVSQEIITAEDFWTIPLAQQLLENEKNKEQALGVTSAFLSEAKPEVDGCNSIQYNLTSEIIQSIFHTYPMIKRKHQEMVPSKMTEKEFWTQFFQSQYFHQNRGSKSLSDAKTGDIFSSLAVEDEQTSLQKFLMSSRNPILDVSEASSSSNDDFGTFKMNTENPGAKPLMRKYNHHSFMICRTLNKDHITKDIDKKKQIQSLTIQDDLLYRQSCEAGNMLQMVKTEAESPRISCTSEEAITALERTKIDIKTCTLHNMHEIVSPREAFASITKLSGECSHTIPKVSSKTMEEIRLCYLNASQILRHFWLCFPVCDTVTEDKIKRMADSLIKFKASVLKDLYSKISLPDHALLLHLSAQIDVALDAHRQWLSKKNRR